MKLILMLLLLIACNKKEEITGSEQPTPKKEEVRSFVTFEVGKCFRSRSNRYDHYIRVDKKYDETTLNVTKIEYLEYSTLIDTFDREYYMEYSCEAFHDMFKTSSPYKKPVECPNEN